MFVQMVAESLAANSFLKYCRMQSRPKMSRKLNKKTSFCSSPSVLLRLDEHDQCTFVVGLQLTIQKHSFIKQLSTSSF